MFGLVWQGLFGAHGYYRNMLSAYFPAIIIDWFFITLIQVVVVSIAIKVLGVIWPWGNFRLTENTNQESCYEIPD